MNRDDLDGWFARADDVLTDWHGSPDAMYSAEPSAAVGLGAVTRSWSSPFTDVLADLRTAILGAQAQAETAYFLPVSDELLATFVPLRERNGLLPQTDPTAEQPVDAPPHPWERALEARRTRNTGPPDRYRLDGRRTRR